MFDRFGQIKRLLREVEADDELFYSMARILKKAHGALMKAGFSEEQATSIVASKTSPITFRR